MVWSCSRNTNVRTFLFNNQLTNCFRTYNTIFSATMKSNTTYCIFFVTEQKRRKKNAVNPIDFQFITSNVYSYGTMDYVLCTCIHIIYIIIYYFSLKIKMSHFLRFMFTLHKRYACVTNFSY
jgi:hypothetical protein